jgi:hypothetical protein
VIITGLALEGGVVTVRGYQLAREVQTGNTQAAVGHAGEIGLRLAGIAMGSLSLRSMRVKPGAVSPSTNGAVAPLESPWTLIDRFRQLKRGLQQLGETIPQTGDGLGTVAFVVVRGRRVFGVNGTLLASDAEVRELARSWKAFLKLGSGRAKSLYHAEALALMRAYERFGGLPQQLTLYVDRLTCDLCQDVLPMLTKAMDVKHLTVVTKDGHIGDIIAGVWKGWR